MTTPVIRTIESRQNEVFVNVNDIIIWLLTNANHSVNDTDRVLYQEITNKLTELRNNGHQP